MKTLPLLVGVLSLSCGFSEASVPWLYQPYDAQPEKIAASGFKNVIMDFSQDGSAEAAYPPAEVQRLTGPGRVALSYLSAGEAENFRSYWNDDWMTDGKRPTWLGAENADAEGNFHARYWESGWKETVLKPALERIVAQGFSGVYLDLVDEFEYWGDSENFVAGKGAAQRAGDPSDEEDAALRMIALVEWVKKTGQQLAGPGRKFQVYTLNGGRLLEYDAAGRFLAAIDGASEEGVFWEETKATPETENADRVKWLKFLQDAGKRVLVVDYIDDGKGYEGENKQRIDLFVEACRKDGFDFYAARMDGDVDSINVIPGVQP